MAKDSKQAFEGASRTSIYPFYPDELRIIGGADLANELEQGPLDVSGKDTWKKGDDGKPVPWSKHPLYRQHRLAQPLKEGFVDSVDLQGVITPIQIIKIDGVPTVAVGRSRTRGLRVANHLRKVKCGVGGKTDAEAAQRCANAALPLKKVKCDYANVSDPKTLLSRQAIENMMREPDTIETVIDIAAILLDETSDYGVTAQMMGVTETTIRGWMAFAQNATPETKKLVADGRIGLSSAALLAKEADPEKQNALLQQFMTDGKPTRRRAAQLSRRDGGKGANPFAGKKELRKFVDFVKAEGGKNAFVEGVVAGMNLQITGQAEDERLGKLFAKYNDTNKE